MLHHSKKYNISIIKWILQQFDWYWKQSYKNCISLFDSNTFFSGSVEWQINNSNVGNRATTSICYFINKDLNCFVWQLSQSISYHVNSCLYKVDSSGIFWLGSVPSKNSQSNYFVNADVWVQGPKCSHFLTPFHKMLASYWSNLAWRESDLVM